MPSPLYGSDGEEVQETTPGGEERVPRERPERGPGPLSASWSPSPPPAPVPAMDLPAESPAKFGENEVDDEDEENLQRPVRSLKDIDPNIGGGKGLQPRTRNSLSIPDNNQSRPTASSGSTKSNRLSHHSAGSGVSRERRLSGIPEQNVVKWRLHFRMIGQNAWSLTETMVMRACEMFPMGESQGKSQMPRTSWNLNNSANSASSFGHASNGSAGSPFSCHLQLDKLTDFADTGLASMASLAENAGVNSQSSLYSQGEENGKISGSLKASLLPVEMFAEDVPQYDNVESLKQSCTVFLLDPREENIDEGLSDLMSRQIEVAGRIYACVKQNGVNGVPPLVSVVLIHGPSSIAAPAGAALDPHGDFPPMDLIKINNTSDVPAFSGHQEGIYNKFVEGLKRFSSQANDEELFYRCNFDDSEALVQSMMRIACKIIMRRRLEDLIPIDLNNLRVGLTPSKKNSCCSLL